MAVKEILDDRVIDLNMDAKNKDEVIRHLAGLLKNAGYIEDLEGYVRDVYVRESEGITESADMWPFPMESRTMWTMWVSQWAAPGI